MGIPRAILRCVVCKRYPRANSTTGMCHKCLAELDICAGSDLLDTDVADLLSLFTDEVKNDR